MEREPVQIADQLTGTQPAPIRPAHVLLVSADDLYAQTLRAWLIRRQWQVTRAADAREALPTLRASGALVVLVDLQGDVLGGLALLAAAQNLRPPVRAVISTPDLTASRLSDAVKRRLGIVGVTIRPCHIEAVGAALEHARSAWGEGGFAAGAPSREVRNPLRVPSTKEQV
jgi:ActR/RegA family two-component response regulator